jgi:hypothetical protein
MEIRRAKLGVSNGCHYDGEVVAHTAPVGLPLPPAGPGCHGWPGPWPAMAADDLAMY